MARVMAVVPGPRISWARWHEFHTTAGKDSGGDEALRIFMDNLPAGDLFRVLELGCGQGEQAIDLARPSYRAHALLPDAPGAA